MNNADFSMMVIEEVCELGRELHEVSVQMGMDNAYETVASSLVSGVVTFLGRNGMTNEQLAQCLHEVARQVFAGETGVLYAHQAGESKGVKPD